MLKLYPTVRNILILVIAFIAYSSAKAQNGEIGELLWGDNFDTFNQEVWNPINGDGCEIGLCGWGNAELEYYTPDNITIEDIPGEPGNKALVLTALKEEHNGSSFTSGKVDTDGKLSVQYGLIEIRMKTPDLNTGLWPAAWLLGTVNTPWPTKGEIDIMEMGHSLEERERQGHPDVDINNYVGANAIFDNGDGSPGMIAFDTNYNQPYVAPEPLNERFVKYRLYWDDSSMRYTIIDNGVEHDLYTGELGLSNEGVTAAFQKPFFFLLNLAVGGNFTDAANANQVTANLPAKLYIDYVHVYEWNGQGEVKLNYDVKENEDGKFGVYTETTETRNELTFGANAEIFIWGDTMQEASIAPSEGNNVLAWETKKSDSWFGGGIVSSFGRDMSAFVNEGSLKFDVKIPADVSFKIGISDNYTNESYLNFPAGETKYGLVRNGEWGQVEIPLADFASIIAYQDINYMFSISSVDGDLPNSTFEFAVDNIFWDDNTTGVTLNNQDLEIPKNEIAVFPMPATDFVNVTIPLFGEYSVVQIIDLVGNVVAAKNSITDKITRFNISNLKAGFYMIKLFNTNKTTKIYKLIKQ